MALLRSNMPAVNDEEGLTVPAGFPPVIDAHVHIFPQGIFSAIRKWFDKNAWQLRYQMDSTAILGFLFSHGISHVVALQYAHKPGIARSLNRYMAEQCGEFMGRVTGMATVYPGESDAAGILQEAFDAGLGGLKLHAHVQCFDMNEDHMQGLYECCKANRKPIIMHVGREPKSPAYSCDPYKLCNADKLESVLKDFPDLNICVPHLGFDEIAPYLQLVEKYDNLWLDTAMVITDYFPISQTIDLRLYREDRVMYGSDFPNIPYAWDRELKALQTAGVSRKALDRITHKNAAGFFKIRL